AALRIVGKGNQPATVPLVPRTARTIDLAVGERASGPILLRHDGSRLDPRTAHRWVRSIGQRAGLDGVHPHMLRAAFIRAALDARGRRRTSSGRPATPTRGPPSTTGAARTWTVTPPTPWSPSSPTADPAPQRTPNTALGGSAPCASPTVGADRHQFRYAAPNV